MSTRRRPTDSVRSSHDHRSFSHRVGRFRSGDHPSLLRARALSEQDRADHGRLDRRARRADPAWPRGRRFRAGRQRCRHRVVRRTIATGEYLAGCDGGRSVVRKAAGIDFPGLDASTSFMLGEVQMDEAAADRHAPRGWRHRARQPGRQQRRAVRCRAEGATASSTPASPRWRTSRGADRRLRHRLRSAQPDAALTVHRRDAGRRPRIGRAASCWPATRHTSILRMVDRVSTSACRTP